mmetsp:Transcript_2321/g.3443  ORF Transcript_2321/g.3443 Transcript_2321/m.3443 type:complete len:1050 (+) Transcript_2321:64-3213(+)
MEKMDLLTIPCPCKLYSDENLIREALESTEKTASLIKWITGDYSTNNELVLQPPVCQTSPTSPCINRVITSLLILNSIRQACREHLENSSQISEQKNDKTATNPVISYESSFPSLSTLNVSSSKPTTEPNVLFARKKGNKEKKKFTTTRVSSGAEQLSKQKRRIRPAKTIASNVGNISDLPSEAPLQMKNNTAVARNGSQNNFPVTQAKTITSNGGNISSLPPEVPLQMRSSTTVENHPFQNNFPMMNSRNTDLIVDQELKLKSNAWKAPQPTKRVANQNSFPAKPKTTVLSNTPVKETNSSPTDVWSKSNATKPESQREILDEKKDAKNEVQSATYIENLSSVYVSLIKNSMVPSTPLELSLLVELLTINDVGPVQNQQNTSQLCLTSTAACRKFSLKSLPKLKDIVANFPLRLLSAFVSCPPIRENLTDLVGELSVILSKRQSTSTEIERGFSGSTQPILALPFDQTRDSRHNYKSREEQALYKNREESRDAFLYQLRNFQNIRGKVLDLAELESSLVTIRRSAQNVIQGIQVANMHWFAEIFFDLLLQIGLIPMEETDKDLLKITNKEKLQKLHKRFSSRVGPSKRNSTKLLSDSDSWQSPENEVFRYFPGHQEFFLLFVQATDSYAFSVHLKSRLLSGIHELAKNVEVKGISEQLPKLEMLAKFLGVVVFSPNWHSSGVTDILNTVSEKEANIWTSSTEFNFPLLDELSKIEDEVRLLITVPWILSLLRMAKWDSFSMRSPHIQEIITRLLSIHQRISKQPSPNVQVVSLCLESFFHQVVGLRRTHSLAGVASHESNGSFSMLTYSAEVQLPDSFLFSSIPHLDEFSALLSSVSKMKQTGAIRKMRPSIVSDEPLNSVLVISATSPSTGNIAPTQLHDFSNKGMEKEASGKDRITERLVEIFFHQHKDLKEICEFVVERAVQNVTSNMEQKLRTQEVKAEILTADTTEEASMLSSIELDMIAEFLKDAEHSVSSTVEQALNILSPFTKSQRVKDIAISLAITHAKKIASTKIKLLIKASAKKLCDKVVQKVQKMKKEEQERQNSL